MWNADSACVIHIVMGRNLWHLCHCVILKRCLGVMFVQVRADRLFGDVEAAGFRMKQTSSPCRHWWWWAFFCFFFKSMAFCFIVLSSKPPMDDFGTTGLLGTDLCFFHDFNFTHLRSLLILTNYLLTAILSHQNTLFYFIWNLLLVFIPLCCKM